MSEATPLKAGEDVSVKTEAKKAELDTYFADLDFSKLEVTLETLLKAGVHFGHLKSRRHPKMDQYIFTTRKNINILDLEKTSEKLKEACAFVSGVVKTGKPVLFVGVKKQTHGTVRNLANRLGMPYVIDRWLGGTLTNFSMIRGRAQYLNTMHEQSERGEWKKYTKFEQVRKQEEIERLEKKVGGIKHMTELPGVIVIADTREAGLVLHEAKRMGVPVVGIVDSNTDPSQVDYPIPGNDDALSSLRILLGSIGKSILEVKKTTETPKATV